MTPPKLPLFEPGEKFGKWTVVRFMGYEFLKGAVYECVCDCGIKREIKAYLLRGRKTSQCRRCAIKAARAGAFNGKL